MSTARAKAQKWGGGWPVLETGPWDALEFPATGSGINTGYKAKHDAAIEADFALCLAQSPDGQVFIKQESNPYITLSSAGNPKTYWWKYADTAGGTDGFL